MNFLVEGVALIVGPSGPLGVSLIVYRHHRCNYSSSFCSTVEILIVVSQ